MGQPQMEVDDVERSRAHIQDRVQSTAPLDPVDREVVVRVAADGEAAERGVAVVPHAPMLVGFVGQIQAQLSTQDNALCVVLLAGVKNLLTQKDVGRLRLHGAINRVEGFRKAARPLAFPDVVAQQGKFQLYSR